MDTVYPLLSKEPLKTQPHSAGGSQVATPFQHTLGFCYWNPHPMVFLKQTWESEELETPNSDIDLGQITSVSETSVFPTVPPRSIKNTNGNSQVNEAF